MKHQIYDKRGSIIEYEEDDEPAYPGWDKAIFWFMYLIVVSAILSGILYRLF